jgi:tight adherence protein B
LSALDVVFYAIELQGAGLDSAALAELTAAADGQVIEADDAVALAEIYDAIATQVVSQHIVEYDTTRSGATVLDVLVTVDGVTYASSMTLQLPSSSDAPAPASTTPGASTPTTPPAAGPQPPIAIAPAPGVLGEAWTLAAGVALLGFTLFIVTSFALSTDGGRRRLSLLDDERAGEHNILKRIYRRLSAAIEATFARSSRAKGLAHSLDAAGIALKPGEFALLVALAVMGALGVGLASGEPLRGLLLAVVAGVLPRLLISRRAGKRRRMFGDQLDGTLQLLAGSLRAGYGLTQALDAVAAESPAPTSDEFGRVVVETRLGRDFTDSLTALARRMESNDMRWVAEAIGIQREVGGDLAEVLDTLAETIRERSQIRRQVHALSAEGRISAVILIALPLVLALVISIINPLYLADLTGTSIGRTLIIVAVVLMVVGVIWLRRIIKVVF